MRRFFVKNLLFVIIVNLLTKPLWVLLIDRNVQNSVGKAVYGPYLQLLNLSLIFQIVLDFGITNYNNRAIAREPEKLQSLFSEMLSARVVLMGLYIVISCIAAIVNGYTGYSMLLLLGILVFQSMNMLVQFVRSNVSALHQFKTDGILSVADRFLMLIVCGFLLLYPATRKHFKIEWYIEAQILCYSIAAVIAYLVLRRIRQVKLQFTFHSGTLLKIMKETLPYALLIFLMSIYTRYDVLMIGHLSGANGAVQTGIYAEAYRLLDASNMFGLMFASILLPLFGRMLVQQENVQPIVRTSVNLLLPGSLMVTVAAFFFGYPIMHKLYPAATAYDGQVFSWLMACFPAFCMMYVYSTLLTANGSLKTLNRQALVGVIINLSLNYILIPRYQALGAAITACITQTAMSAGFMLLCHRIIRLPIHIRWIGAHALYLVVIVLLGYAVTQLQTTWLLQLMAFGGLCVAAMFLFRFISVTSVKQLMSRQ